MNKTKRNIFALLSIVLLCALDQFTKYLVVSNMKLGEVIPLIDGVFQLRYIRNDGAAWSILEGKQIFFVIMTLFVLFFLGKLFITLPEDKKFTPVRIIVVFLTSGALGNLIDRVWSGEALFKGSVVDFFDFCLINFPVFNVADIYVSVTMVLLVVLMLFKYSEKDFDVIYDCCVKFGKKKVQDGLAVEQTAEQTTEQEELTAESADEQEGQTDEPTE